MKKANTQPGQNIQMEIIRLESDSEDAQTLGKNCESQKSNQEVINLEESVENQKSNSQSSISTSASRGNLPLNKPNSSEITENKIPSMFSISQRTKKILERINEKNRKAKLLNKYTQEKENKENNLDKNRFIGKKTKSKEPNRAEKKVKEKKIK